MTTTLERETYTLSAVMEAPTASGGTDMIVRGIKVFRVGAFRNSRGQRNEWTAERLQSAVDNFNHLRRSRILPDVPVRLDHTTSMRDVVGYFHELHFDGTFLLADILFTKREAYDEYQSGHLRNVSLEIGQYLTNNEQLYDNVVQGLAFVDIPAVEGLHQREPGGTSMSTSSDQKDAKDAKATDGSPPAAPAATPPAAPAPTSPAAPAPTSPATPASGEPSPATPAPGTPSPATDQHRAAPTVQTFRVNGADTQDVVAVQAHINALEQFRADTRSAARSSFVDDMFRGGKITEAQRDEFGKHVGTLNDDQFAAFRALYDAMPASNLFAKHPTTTDPAVAASRVDEADQLAIDRETVATWRRQNKTDDFIQKQPQWRRVQAADAK